MSLAKILVADDEPNIVISLEYLMKREGYTVLVARDGQEALDVITRERPDLVLLDVMMPRKTGFEVCQAVRADEALQADLARDFPEVLARCQARARFMREVIGMQVPDCLLPLADTCGIVAPWLLDPAQVIAI